MNKIDKIKTIENLNIEAVMLIKKATVIALKPKSKYPKVALNRAFKIMCIMFAIRSIQMQIMTVKSQPIFPVGGNIYGIVVEPNYN